MENIGRAFASLSARAFAAAHLVVRSTPGRRRALRSQLNCMKILLPFLCAVLACTPAFADLQSDMVTVADAVFSGNGTPDQIDWSRFSFQLTPESQPVDVAAMVRNVDAGMQANGETLFLKSQGAVQALERKGKTVSQYLQEDKGLTLATYDNENTPALLFISQKTGEPTRRFDFHRSDDDRLQLVRVTLRPPGRD